MVRFAALATLLCGCAQIFGLDETSSRPPPSLTIQRASIGSRVLYAPQDLSTSMGAYLVADAAAPSGLTRVPVTQAEPGRWSSTLTRPAPLLFDLPDFPRPVLRLFDFPQPEVKALFGVLEHPSPEPAPPGAMLSVNVTLNSPHAAGERYELFIVGAWASAAIPAPVVGATAFSQNVSSMALGSLTGRPIERITAEDTPLVLRYAGNELRGALRAAPFDQTGADVITGMMTGVTPQPFSFAIDQVDVIQRYSAVRPPFGTPTMGWTLRAAPGALLNNDAGPLLASGGPSDMVTVNSQAQNPFEPDWPSTVFWNTQATRSYTPPSAGIPATLVANMHQRAILAPGLQMLLPAPLPSAIAIGGAALSTDGVAIPRPAGPVEATFVADGAGNTLYQLQLFKLVPNTGSTALVLESKVSAAGAQPRFTLPPDLFEAGALYTLRATAVAGGFPAIADADLTERDLPIAIASVDSGVFQVMP